MPQMYVMCRPKVVRFCGGNINSRSGLECPYHGPWNVQKYHDGAYYDCRPVQPCYDCVLRASKLYFLKYNVLITYGYLEGPVHSSGVALQPAG